MLLDESKTRRGFPASFLIPKEARLRLQPLAGDGEPYHVVLRESTFLYNAFGDRNRHAASGLGEDSLRSPEQLDSFDHLGIGNVFAPAAALTDSLGCEVTVRRIAD